MRAYDTPCAGSAAVHPAARVVYWHRDLPPLDATIVSEDVLEATSVRIPGTLSRRDELWKHCYRDLIAHADTRLTQEVTRLQGRYAHVLEESIDSRHDAATGESWLHGQFHFVLLR